MSYIEVTGKTEEEAIRKALVQLGLEREEVSVELLERAKQGFFGIGASPAKIRVSYEEPQAEPVPPVAEKTAVRETVPPAEKTTVRKPEPAVKPVEAAKLAEAEKPAETAKPVQAAALREADEDEMAQRIRTFLCGLLAQMDSPAEIRIDCPEKGRYRVLLEGEKLGPLIGRRGETLDAIQQLTGYAVNRGNDKGRIRVQIDAEGYREKREQSLEHLAKKVAAKVLKYRRNVTLEPMNAYERHVIHTVLQDMEGISTYSVGSEPNRRVVVAYGTKRNSRNG